jgi:quercetin dioxygenase-like cupin family protein
MQICLDAGQEIPPHPEDYSVLFYVIGGNGTITTAEGAWDVQADDIVLVGKGEVRGIVAKTRMRVLGIQEPH